MAGQPKLHAKIGNKGDADAAVVNETSKLVVADFNRFIGRAERFLATLPRPSIS